MQTMVFFGRSKTSDPGVFKKKKKKKKKKIKNIFCSKSVRIAVGAELLQEYCFVCPWLSLALSVQLQSHKISNGRRGRFPSCPMYAPTPCQSCRVSCRRRFLEFVSLLYVYARRRVKRLPVVRNPLSPIAPRHSIDNWPNVARPSRFMSFCRFSSPSCCPSSCSTRNATCSTSRGFKVGGGHVDSSGRS